MDLRVRFVRLVRWTVLRVRFTVGIILVLGRIMVVVWILRLDFVID